MGLNVGGTGLGTRHWTRRRNTSFGKIDMTLDIGGTNPGIEDMELDFSDYGHAMACDACG